MFGLEHALEHQTHYGELKDTSNSSGKQRAANLNTKHDREEDIRKLRDLYLR